MADTHRVTCAINGRRIAFDVHPRARLLDVLRREARLTGTKEGCGEGECGACAVLLNGELINSCLTPAAHADGGIITTIEGVANDEELHIVQEAFLECAGAQCGICTPGMVLCRCTGYMRIFESVLHACRQLPHGLRQ